MPERVSPLVLITRPIKAAQTLQQALETRGFATMVEPMLSIESCSPTPTALDGVQAIVLTSANAVPALTAEARGVKIFSVGKATAEAARAVGCRDVIAGDGDGAALASLIAATCRPEDGLLLHIGGEVVREDLHRHLEAGGFHTKREVVYRAVPVRALSARLVTAWQSREIASVLLFSPRTAEVLVRLLIEHGLQGHVDRTVAICVSEAAATPCRELDWREICLAPQPNQDALIRTLEGSGILC